MQGFANNLQIEETAGDHGGYFIGDVAGVYAHLNGKTGMFLGNLPDVGADIVPTTAAGVTLQNNDQDGGGVAELIMNFNAFAFGGINGEGTTANAVEFRGERAAFLDPSSRLQGQWLTDNTIPIW